ncbi:MAG: HAD-IIIA family hydrolase [Cyclobacteriaceae bacterium]
MKENIKFLVLDVDGTMTDGGVYVLDNGQQFKKFNAQDGLGIRMAMKAGIEVGIISHSLVKEMVSSRANALGMKYFYIGQESKLDVLKQWLEELSLKPENVAFMGDDLNDLEIMNYVGLSVCPANAVAKIKESADVVLEKSGGNGAVRAFIDDYLLS